ncbi:MAG: hypothetical protein WC677_00615 [Clostridia bacterium]
MKKIGANSIKISWSKSTGATEYKLYRLKSAKTQYSYIANTKSLSFTNKGLKDGQIYYYKVRAYRINAKSVEVSNYSLTTSTI